MTTLRIDDMPEPWTIEQDGKVLARGNAPVLEIELGPGKYVITSLGQIEVEILEDGSAKWRFLPIVRRIPLEGGNALVVSYPPPPEEQGLAVVPGSR